MRDDMVVTGQVTRAGNGGGQAGVAGWSVPGYTEVKTLGSGGFGDVVLARHDGSGTLVAIKYLRRHLLADPEFAELFRGEAAVLASLDDPHVVRLYEYVESPSGAAIVMELVDGVSLRQILARQGGTTPEAALVVLQGSLLGLAAAHARGVVHRDYKPDNVLVDGDGASKLTDFGIAARAWDRSARGGTLAYAPPEQFAGGPASPAGDVYAATATFFECLTGRPPFRGDTAEALLYQHMSEPVPVDAVPEPVRPLVAAGMAKQPEDRPADAAAFVAVLNEVAAGAYGPDWHDRGRSHLAEAALLLAALWPSGGPPGVQGTTVEQIPLHQRSWRSRLRRSGRVKKAIAAAIVVVVAAAGTVLAFRLTGSHPVTLPAVTGVSPASGSTMGGSTVTITGTGLAGATVVRFGGVAGTIRADSGTQVTVISPPSTGAVDIAVTTAAITADSGAQVTATGAGTVDITVTTPAGTSKPTAAGHYTYIAPRPAVSGESPDGGSTAGGTTVSISGTGLAGATGVRFGAAAAAITADSSTQVTVTSPPGTGTVTITVTTPAGTSQTTAAGHYTYTTHPKPAQSISFTAPAPGTPGGSARLSATGGGSGDPVVFSVDPASGPGVCTVSGTTVTFTAAGGCVIDANQAGTGRYAGAPQVQRTITVNAIPQSISFTAPARGTVRGSAALSATGGGSGNPVVFSVDPASGPGVCTVSGTTVTFTAAGGCVIDANQAGTGRYADAPQVQRTITVNAVPQSAVSVASPTLTTAPSAGGTVGSVVLNDSATLSGGSSPGGSITFDLYAPSQTCGSGAPAYTQTVPVSGNGPYSTTDTVAASAAGTWSWTAMYSGDSGNSGASSTCGQETVAVAKASPSLSTAPSSGGTAGSVTLNDSATVSAGHTPGGSITFDLYSPSQTCGSGTPAYTQTVPVSGNGSYSTTNTVAASTPGTWSWTAAYSGDANNNGTSSTCGQETVTVSAAVPVAVPAAVPQGSCEGTGSISELVSGSNVIAYVPKGSWDSAQTGIDVVNVEGSSITKTQIPTGSDVINSCASNSVTGQTVCTANNNNVYVLKGTGLDPSVATNPLTDGGTGTISFSGGAATTTGVAMDAVDNKALLTISEDGTAGFQFLDLSTDTFESPFATKNPGGEISEDPLIDPIHHIIGSASEDNNFEITNVSTSTSPQFYEQNLSTAVTSGELDSTSEDCSTGILLAPAEGGNPSGVEVADIQNAGTAPEAVFTPGSPGSWTAPEQFQTLTGSSLAAGASGSAVAQGTHTGVIAGEFGGDGLTALALPTTSGAGATPSIQSWVSCQTGPDPSGNTFFMGDDPHTLAAYQSPNGGDAIALLVNEGATEMVRVDLTAMLNPATVPATGDVCTSGTLPSSVESFIPLP